MSDRCTGHCCEEFVIGPDSLLLLRTSPETVEDGHFIAAMLVPVRIAEVGDPLPGGASISMERQHVWTCKHFDRETRNCTAYEQRPEMCRAYPYNQACFQTS